MIDGLGWMLAYGTIGYIIYRAVWRATPSAVGGVLTLRPGKDYGFMVGDDLYAYPAYGNYHGLDLRLDIEMPHIYLDSLKSGGREVGAVFDKSQRISLEGDFHKYFNVFVPKHYEAVALSVLTPDVMETLQKYASCYDVEIYGDHLRVISKKKVLGSPDEQAKMIGVADKILQQIEDRSSHWMKSNALQAIDQDLLVYPSQGFRWFGRYMSWIRFWLSLFWLLCVLGIAASGVMLVYANHAISGVALIAGAVAAFVGLQYYTAASQRDTRFWSRRG